MYKTKLYFNSGVCKCGCSWEDHHLGMIVNSNGFNAIQDYLKKHHPDHKINGHSYPMYIPNECDRYGCNESGGMKYNEDSGEYEDHCHQYEDKDGPLGYVEWE